MKSLFVVSGAALLLALNLPKCPGPPPGPICTKPGQTCCWTYDVPSSQWVKVPCTDPSPEPSPTPEPTPTPTPEPTPTPTPEPTPTPTPTPPPTPPPPPSPSPTPPACPPLACIHATVHIAIGPGEQIVPYPVACSSCRVVLDSTPLFEVCLARGRCNSEWDLYCRGRVCEDPRGYTWRQVAGPTTPYWVQEPGPDRGYQLKAMTQAPGNYAFEVCAAGPVDGEGQPVVVSGPQCGRVEYQVRP